MTSGSSAFEVGGRTIALPVRVHDGDQWSAQFLVRAGAAQAVVDDPRLEVVQLLPRRAAASISFARYRDTDLGPYDEVVIANFSLMERVLRRSPWDQEGRARARVGGTKLELSSHPLADELRSLSLPKRALMSATMREMRAVFGPPVEL